MSVLTNIIVLLIFIISFIFFGQYWMRKNKRIISNGINILNKIEEYYKNILVLEEKLVVSTQEAKDLLLIESTEAKNDIKLAADDAKNDIKLAADDAKRLLINTIE